MRRPLALTLVLAAAACAPALKEPPSIGSLAKRPPSGTSDVAALLRDAESAWARRPDVAAVRDAEALFLQAAQDESSGVDALIGAARAKAWLADKETDAKARQDLAVSCVQTTQWCVKRQPESAACNTWLAIGLGLQAREMRSTAEDGVKKMVAALERAIAEDTDYDHAAPERILAIVLVRAPGWPVGPGDPEAALEHAKKAVALDGAYPPNVLALGEALGAQKDRARARDAYARAKSLAEERRAAGDPDAPDWITQADQGLTKLK